MSVTGYDPEDDEPEFAEPCDIPSTQFLDMTDRLVCEGYHRIDVLWALVFTAADLIAELQGERDELDSGDEK